MMRQRRRFGIFAALIGSIFLAACTTPEPRLGETVFVVLPEDDGSVGEISIDDGTTVVVLNQALAAATTNRDGSVRNTSVSDQDVEEIWGAALSAQPLLPRNFILYFKRNTDTLTPDSVAQFEAVFMEVERRQLPEVDVVGHTDTAGETDYNAGLSLARAEKIRDLLVKRGIDVDGISAIGRGEIDLLVGTADDVPEPLNRRVQITVR